MREYLLFRLYGPLAAWGDIAVGEQRPSHVHPTRSAVFGLVAAALGIARDDEKGLQALAHGYLLASRLDAAGELMVDYHTTQVPPEARGRVAHTRRDELSWPKLGTILSSREYRQDACFSIALWAAEQAPFALQKVADALKKPHWVPYLGRKSCPLALPMQPRLVEAKTLREAFAGYGADDDLLRALPFANDKRVFWEALSKEEAGYSDAMILTRNDQVLSRQRWQFGSRREYAAIGGAR